MKRDADTATLVSPRVLQRDLVCEPMADVNMPPEGEGISSSYAPTDVALPTPGSVSDAIGSREFSIVPTLRTTGYRQRTVHSVVFKMVEIGAESDRELVVCEVNDEGHDGSLAFYGGSAASSGNDGVSLADLAGHIAIVAADLERRDDLPGSS
eukprot:s2640_g16.t1